MFNRTARPASAEQEQKITKVVIELMRHGKRESFPDDIEKDSDPDIRLKPLGREQADARGHALDVQPEVSLGWGSPRTRAQETAYRAMLAETGIIGPDDTFEEIEEKIAEHQTVGKKMLADERLDFRDDGPIAPDGKEAYFGGYYMKWMANDSDRDAIEKHDTTSSTFSREAGNIADFLRRYTKAGENFNHLVNSSDEKAEQYAQFGNQIERYVGTHMGVTEAFIAKVLELVQGEEAKETFLASVGAGFAETEGAHIEIVNTGAQQTIELTYTLKDKENGDRKMTVEFGADTLERIIADREAFEEQVRAHAAA